MSVRLALVPTAKVADLVEEEGTESLVIICTRKIARYTGDS